MSSEKTTFIEMVARFKSELANHDQNKYSDAAIHDFGDIICNCISSILYGAWQIAKDDGSDGVSAKHMRLALNAFRKSNTGQAPKLSMSIGGILAGSGIQLFVTPQIETFSRVYLLLAAGLTTVGICMMAWGISRG
jgi:hypothetical protein